MQQHTSRSREETDCKADHALYCLIELNDLALAASLVKICSRVCRKYINLTQVSLVIHLCQLQLLCCMAVSNIKKYYTKRNRRS